MLTFAKSTLVLFILLPLTNVRAAPIPADSGDLRSALRSLLSEITAEPGPTATVSASSAVVTTTDDTGDNTSTLVEPQTSTSASTLAFVTVISSVGGPAITLAPSGPTTVFGGSTYTIMTATPSPTDGGYDGDSASATVSSSSSTATPSSDGDGSDDGEDSSSTASSASPSATDTGDDEKEDEKGGDESDSPSTTTSNEAATSTSGKKNGSSTVKPLAFSSSVGTALLAVSLGVIFGAWVC